MVRLFVASDLGFGEPVDLDADASRYLKTVMRLTPGAELVLFNGRDGEWAANLTALDKRSARVVPRAKLRDQPQPSPLELVLALVKRSALEWAVEKATELGVGHIRLIHTRRSVADHTNVSRLLAIATEAAEQCERLDVPILHAPERFDRFLAAWPLDAPLMFCDETSVRDDGTATDVRAPILTVLDAVADVGSMRLAVLIGPEGGIDPTERAQLLEHAAVRRVTLGRRILRVETAVVAALAVIQAGLEQPGRA